MIRLTNGLANRVHPSHHGHSKRSGWSGFGLTTFMQTQLAHAHFELCRSKIAAIQAVSLWKCYPRHHCIWICAMYSNFSALSGHFFYEAKDVTRHLPLANTSCLAVHAAKFKRGISMWSSIVNQNLAACQETWVRSSPSTKYLLWEHIRRHLAR